MFKAKSRFEAKTVLAGLLALFLAAGAVVVAVALGTVSLDAQDTKYSPQGDCRTSGSGNTRRRARTGGSTPWGSRWDASRVPAPETRRAIREPTDVGSHVDGASLFGVMDLVGNVWQWTDEFQDLHTRAAILHGGSYYQPQGSLWYFPQATRLDAHGKYLRMAPSLDRSGTVGFRCVVDAGD